MHIALSISLFDSVNNRSALPLKLSLDGRCTAAKIQSAIAHRAPCDVLRDHTIVNDLLHVHHCSESRVKDRLRRWQPICYGHHT